MIKILILILLMVLQLISLMYLMIWSISKFVNVETDKKTLQQKVLKKYIFVALIDVIVFSIIFYYNGYQASLWQIEGIVIIISSLINWRAIKKNAVMDNIVKKP